MTAALAGRGVWVIGAGGAIGAGVSDHLDGVGARVVRSSRSSGDPRVDVRDAASVVAGEAVARERLGGIDALVVSITVPIFGDFLELDDSAWTTVLDTKLTGSLRAVRAVAPGMIERGGGDIILIAGTGRGVPPLLTHLPGGAANAALNFLVQGLSARLGREGIRINSISPGPIQSPRLDAMKAVGASGATHIGRPGTVGDVASAVAFLLSPEGGFVAGTNLVLDGGGRLGL